MKTPRNLARLLSLALLLAGLVSWTTLPIHSLGKAAQAATGAGLRPPNDQPRSRVIANGRIAFVFFRDEGPTSDICTMNSDGSDRRPLTSSQGDERNVGPAWSPDGTRIAFVRTHGKHGSSQFTSQILVMNADGSDQKSLTEAGEWDSSFAWSPDSTQIAFDTIVVEDASRHYQILVMNADGTNLRQLTHSAEGDTSPRWSPDGTKIAFLRRGALAVMNADGSDQKTIGKPYTPFVWSPDNSRLAFASLDDLGIVLVNVDGSNMTRITIAPSDGWFEFGFDAYPSWSPDGSKIIFSRFVGCNIELVGCRESQVWVVNADGSKPTKLTDDVVASAFDPIWSPDGTRIIFESGGDYFVMSSDGVGVTNITNTKLETEYGASWQPLLVASCAESISPTEQTFEATGGAGSIDVTAASECSWNASTNVAWISIASSSGAANGVVGYSVAANPSTSSRTAALIVAGRLFTITQSGVPVRITGASLAGKKLFLFGENFDPGAVILLNGEKQITRNDSQNPKNTLIGKKAGKVIKAGDRLQVRNPNGTLSEEFTFSDM
jgi:Tol biopolymer transport system component